MVREPRRETLLDFNPTARRSTGAQLPIAQPFVASQSHVAYIKKLGGAPHVQA